MEQSRIWSYFQTEGINVFSGASSRLQYLAEEAEKLVKPSSPVALNIGIGDGFLEQHLSLKGWKIRSLDPSEGAIKRAIEMGIEATVGCIEALPYRQNTFDVVFCSEVLEHLSDLQLDEGIHEVLRVLKPGGYFLGTIPDKEDLDKNKVICPGCGKIFHRWGHLQSFDETKLATLIPDDLALRVRPKLFISWEGLNLKRRVAAFIKLILFYLGSHGSNETLYFQARKLEG